MQSNWTLLGGQLHRWKSLTLDGDWAAWIGFAPFLSQKTLVEKAYDPIFHDEHPDTDCNPHPFLKSYHTLPVLELLALSNIQWEGRLPEIAAPNLSTIMLDRVIIYPREYANLVSGAPNVKCISLRNVTFCARSETEQLRVSHSRVQSLTFRCKVPDSQNPLQLLLQLLETADSLLHLVVSPGAGADFANWSTRNLVIQCSPVLTVTSLDLHLGHLCLDSQGPEIQVLQVVKFISLFERVVDLTIRGTPLLPRAYWGELDPHPVHWGRARSPPPFTSKTFHLI